MDLPAGFPLGPKLMEVVDQTLKFIKLEYGVWLRDMVKLGIQDIRVYNVVDQPHCTRKDLLELDDLLADRRQAEFTTSGICLDMHPHFGAAFRFVNVGSAAGIKYTIADYGRLVRWQMSRDQLLKIQLSSTTLH